MQNPMFQPMRSLIYVDCAKEEYRVKLQHWLYGTHVPDSISQFEPYVSKYAFYNALPTPPQGERFGTNRMQLTEHYWMINQCGDFCQNKILTEVFPPEVLIWQGNLPENAQGDNFEGDDARAVNVEGAHPFVFAFVPVWWDEDLKGKGRTIAAGPNYRWQFMIKYPDGVQPEEGDKWFHNELVPYLQAQPEVNRLVTSKILQEINGCEFYRVVEVWFDGPEEWYKVAVERADQIAKPAWAQVEQFPYLKPFHNFESIFLSDIATSNNLAQYRGYITLR